MSDRTVWPDEPLVAHGANTRGRDLIIGDVHGHYDTLEHALDQLRFNPSADRLFSVGDLIDRGPRTADTLEWIEQRRIAAVRGNHEQMMVTALTLERGELHKSGHGADWVDNGGGWWWGWSGKYCDEHGRPTSPQRGPDHNDRRTRWLDAMRTVPFARTIETAGGTVGIVHTLGSYHDDWDKICEGLQMGAARAKSEERAGHPFSIRPDPGLLWGRAEVEREDRNANDLPKAVRNIDLLITGHTPDKRARWTRRNVICIDTGFHIAQFGHLTVAEVQTGEVRLHRFRRVEPPPRDTGTQR